MKHFPLRGVAVLLVGTALLVAGCSASNNDDDTSSKPSPASTEDSTSATPSAADLAAVKTIKVTGKEGTEPKVSFDAPLKVSALTTNVVSDGSGAKLSEGTVMSLQGVTYDGTTGKKISYDSAGAPKAGDMSTIGKAWATMPEAVALSPANFTQGMEGLPKALEGKKVGARFVVAVPPTASSSATASPADTSTQSTQVLVFEVVGTEPSKAEGATVPPVAGLPTVTRAEDGTPTITIPKDYKAPDKLVVQPLIKGSGKPVAKGQAVVVQYTGELTDGTVFDSSWQRGNPYTVPEIGAGYVIKGWDEGLVGQTVGSQVLLVVPPSLGYEDKANGSIPANSTLVFVVDILAAY